MFHRTGLRGCGAAGAGRDGLGRRFGDGSAGFHLSQREVKSDSTGPSEDFQFIPRNKTAGKYMQNKKKSQLKYQIKNVCLRFDIRNILSFLKSRTIDILFGSELILKICFSVYVLIMSRIIKRKLLNFFKKKMLALALATLFDNRPSSTWSDTYQTHPEVTMPCSQLQWSGWIMVLLYWYTGTERNNGLVILGQRRWRDWSYWHRILTEKLYWDRGPTHWSRWDQDHECTGYTGTASLNQNGVNVQARYFLGAHCVFVCLCVFGCPVVAVNMQSIEVEGPRQLLGLAGKHAAAIFT